ncbi:MAG: hypothetical protein PHE08_02525 [Bacteroidales bacterium]|nr:hypothetical protein [Bacteroidales bacterium]
MKTKNDLMYLWIYLIILGLSLTSCEKETEIITSQLDQTTIIPQEISNSCEDYELPYVIDGRLVFKDSTSYWKHQDWIFRNQGNPEVIQDFNKSIGLISMMQVYEEGLLSLENCNEVSNEFIKSHKNVFYETNIAESVIQDLQAPNILAYCANEFGVYQVGNSIFRISHNYLYTIIDGDTEKIPMIVNAKGNEISLENIKTTEIKKGQLKDQYSYRTSYFDSNRRIVSRLRYDIIGNSYYYRAITNSQKKTLGIWLGKTLDGVWVSWGEGYYISNGTTYDISSATHGSSSYQTIDVDFAVSVMPITSGELATTHYGKYGSTTKSISYSNAFTGTH